MSHPKVQEVLNQEIRLVGKEQAETGGGGLLGQSCLWIFEGDINGQCRAGEQQS